MGNRFFISDTHYGHTNTWEKFKNPDGSPLRPFTSTEEMDEVMVSRWNKVVGPNDAVYHLGDVVIAKRHLETVKRLNGKKRLIRGNHDIFKDELYRAAGFEQIHGVKVFDDFICSHIPLHPDSITTRFRCNVHGHLHGNRVTRVLNGVTEIDPRYFSVCVEQINFTPISMDDLKSAIQAQFDKYNYIPHEAWGNGSGPG